ncbi:MAG: DUF6247 family protein [Pseudonocardiaceae bacterium]
MTVTRIERSGSAIRAVLFGVAVKRRAQFEVGFCAAMDRVAEDFDLSGVHAVVVQSHAVARMHTQRCDRGRRKF